MTGLVQHSPNWLQKKLYPQNSLPNTYNQLKSKKLPQISRVCTQLLINRSSQELGDKLAVQGRQKKTKEQHVNINHNILLQRLYRRSKIRPQDVGCVGIFFITPKIGVLSTSYCVGLVTGPQRYNTAQKQPHKLNNPLHVSRLHQYSASMQEPRNDENPGWTFLTF